MQFDLGPLGQQTILSSLVLVVGAYFIGTFIYTIFRVLLSTLVLPGKPISSFGPKGSWAVVTGASDGIGKEFSLQLARKGFNIILVSRTQSKLDALASQITSTSSGTSVEVLAMDFSKNLDSDYAKLEKIIQGKQIAILINNVGQSHSIPVDFAETPLDEIQSIVNINCMGTLRATKTVVPAMIPNKRGLVITMGSFGGLAPTPMLATYSGSKAFLQYWSNAIASELAPHGITVHFIHSYLVTSAMSKIKRSNWQVPTEKAFVSSALNKIGRRGGSIGYPHSGTPFWSHAIALAILIKGWGMFNKPLMEYNRRMHIQIRQRALKKAERAKGTVKKEL